jgi:hypothetical protein
MRPVGSTFNISYPPSDFSTDRRPCTITYRVKAHAKAMRFDGDEVGVDVEEIEPVKVVYGKPERIYRVQVSH